MNDSTSKLVESVALGTIRPIDAERLLNAVARAEAGVPTGAQQNVISHNPVDARK